MESLLKSIPALEGQPVRVRFLPALHSYHGRLLSGVSRGDEVHAGSHVRRRLIVLDEALLEKPKELGRILVHEIFHFAWLRLSNQTRRAWEAVLAGEMERGARGELGWSAELRKGKLTARDHLRRTRRWREYVCESFCDTAAWIWAAAGKHEEYTLRTHFQHARQRWFRDFIGGDQPIPI